MNMMNIGRFTGCYLPEQEDGLFDSSLRMWVQFTGTSDAALQTEIDKQLAALAALPGGCEETVRVLDVENGAVVVRVYMYAEQRESDNETRSFAAELTQEEMRGLIDLYCNEYRKRLAQVHIK